MITVSFITHFDINQRKLRIYDSTNYAGSGILISNVKGIIKVTSPRGIIYNNINYHIPDVNQSQSLFSGYIQLPQDAHGFILAGAYTIQYSVLNLTDNSVSVESNSYTYSFIVPQITINQVVDGYNSLLNSIDTTNYGVYASLSRVHEVTPPSGSPLSVVSNGNQTISYLADIWSGDWVSQIISTLVYTESDGLVIDAVLTLTQKTTAYNNDMNVIRGYIETFKLLYETARATDKNMAYQIQASLLKINTAYSEYDLALFYNDLTTAYLKTVDIINELNDYITITFPEEIHPFINNTGGSTHPPVSIATSNYGVSINTSQAMSFSLASISSGGMLKTLSGSALDYLGGDGNWNRLSSSNYILKSDFTNYDSVRAITSTEITNWNIAYGWGNHAMYGYAVATNYYTKINLQTNNQSQVHFGNLTNKPTTLLEYGITDGMIGNSTIIEGTHTKITYDSKGLVTNGSDLTAFDIPSLPWGKIISGVPTTISGYGITDAYTKTQVDNYTWGWSSITSGIPDSLSGYGILDAYTQSQTNALTWDFATSISGKPITLFGYGITDALSISHPANNVINSGLGNLYLNDAGVYVVPLISGALDTQLVYIDGTETSGNANLTFNKTTNTISALNAIIGTGLVSSQLNFFDASMNIVGDSGDLKFTDAHYSKTLSQLVSGASNFWTAIGNNIYYYNTGADKVGINTVSPTAELEIVGHIIADYFDSSYIRYKNSNILIGPNAGDNETGSNLLYIANTNTPTPIILGDLINQTLIFNADVYINQINRLNFGSSDVYIRRDSSDNLIFRDLNSKGGAEISLTDITTLTGYSLKSDFISYTSVTSITAANKTTWNKASVILTSGDGSKYLGDNGIYYTAASGGVTPTDNILKWDSGSSYYRAYSSKIEAGGVSSGGKLYLGTTDPTNTNRLNYDGYLVVGQFLSRGTGVGYGIRGENTSSGDGIQGTSNSGVGVRGVSATGIASLFESSLGNSKDISQFNNNGVIQCSINTSGINIITGSTYKINGVNLSATNVGAEPTLTKGNLTESISSVLTITGGTSAIIGAGLVIEVKQANTSTSGYLSYTNWNTFNNKQPAGNYITSLTGEATGSGSGAAVITLTNSAVIGKVLTGYSSGSGTITATDSILQSIEKLGYDKHVAATVVTTNGLAISGQQISIGSASASTNGALVSNDWNTFNNKKPLQSVGLTFNPVNLVLFDKDYQYNSYNVTSNITITASLTGAVALNSVRLTLVGDGIHTVSFSGILPDPASIYFNNNIGAINDITLFYDGTYIYYNIPSLIQSEPYLETPLYNEYILSSSTIDVRSWVNPLVVSVPSQTGNTGKFLTTDGTNTSWATVTSGGVTPVSGLLSWNSGTSKYEPYSAQQSFLSFDISNINPSLHTRININGDLYTFLKGTTSGSTDRIIEVFNNNTGEAIFTANNYDGGSGISVVNNLSGAGIYINNQSTGNGLRILNYGTGRGISSENCSMYSTSGSQLYLSRTASGSVNHTGTFIEVYDDPSSSGTISGSVLKATIGSTIRIDLNPRSTSISYLFDTNTTLTGTNKLLSIQNNTVERFRVTPVNTAIPVGTSTTFATIGGTLKDFYTDVSTSGTSETDLYSYTIPANTLVNNGDKIEFNIVLDTSFSPNYSYIRLYFAGTSRIMCNNLFLSGISGFKICIIRVSPSVCRIKYEGGLNSGGINYIDYSEMTSKDWTISNILKVTGQCSTNSITAKFGTIEYKPAAIN